MSSFLEIRKEISFLYHETRTGIKQMLGLMQSVLLLTVSVDWTDLAQNLLIPIEKNSTNPPQRILQET